MSIYDVIVIGSGMSGLCCAAILAKFGKRVLVIEKHDRLGGCLHTFKKDGYTFDSGNHYIGHVSEDDQTVLSFVSGGIMAVPTNNPVVETFIKDSNTFTLHAGTHHWTQMSGVGPDKVSNMADRMWWIAIIKLVPVIVARVMWFLLWILYPSTEQSYATFMESNSNHTTNETIWWDMQEGDWGVNSSEVPAMVGAAVTRHYIKGTMSLHPSFVRSVYKTIRRNGGTVYVNTNVVKINTNDMTGEVESVDIVTKRNIKNTVYTSTIISSIGAKNTCGLVNIPSLDDVCDKIGPSTGHFSVFIGANSTRVNMDLPTSTVWIKDEQHYMFVSSNESRGKTSIHILVPMEYAIYTDYDEFKHTKMKELQRHFLHYFPKVRPYIDCCFAGSPSTTQKYLNSHRGSSYGLKCTFDRFHDFHCVRTLRPDTPIKGLFLTGVDILCMGVSSAISSSIMTVRQVLGISLWDTLMKRDVMDIIRKRN